MGSAEGAGWAGAGVLAMDHRRSSFKSGIVLIAGGSGV